jgi:arylsulfatase A-like enzyme
MPGYRNLRAGFTIAAGVFSGCSGRESTPPRHVLLIVVDTQRADHLSCYGYPRPTSPSIDALAKEGVLFEHCVSQASWTGPSMVSMMTACYVGEEALRIPDDRTTLAEVFREHGFATGAFICNDLLSPENRFERGFDEFQWKLTPYGSNQPILEWIRAHKDVPSFAYVHLNEVHDDGEKRADKSRYGPEPVSQKGRFRKEKGAISPERRTYYDQVTEKLHLADEPASLATIEAEIGGYDDDVAYCDHRIGEILDEYKKLGLWDSTAVLLGADHGEGLWAREQFPEGTRKTAMDKGEPATLVNVLQMTHGSQAAIELVHVPLILRAPGLDAASVAPWVENVDIGPTLLELCRLPIPKSAQGRSLLDLARHPGSKKGVEEAVFTFTRFHSSVITQEGMQLLHPSPRGECDFALGDELYDLPRDSEARKNLLSGHGELAQRLSKTAAQRVKAGIKAGSGPIGPNTMKALYGLGYIDSGVVDVVSEQLAAMSTDDLIRGIRESYDCLVKLQKLRALKGRDLTDEQRAALRAIAEHEISIALKEAIHSLLSR